MKKVLISSFDMEVGGVERSLISMLSNFDYQSFDVDLMLYSHTGDFMEDIPRQPSLLDEIPVYKTFRLPISETLKKGYVFIGLVRILAKLKASFDNAPETGYKQMQYMWKYALPFLPKLQKKYDVAISYLWPHYFVAEKVEATIKIAWIHTDYSTVETDIDVDVAMWNKFDYIIAVSEECKNAFTNKYPMLKNKTIVIENITSPDFVHALAKEQIEKKIENDDRFKLLTVARLSHAKGIDNAVKALKLLKDKGYHDIVWYIVGYGGDELHIKRLIEEHELIDQFILLGKKTNPYPYMRVADLYVQPSRYEGKAVTVGEAQILGKPVLITDYTTAASQVNHNVDGIICELSIQGIANGIEYLYKDEYKREQLSSNCKKTNYNNKEELHKLYRILLGGTIDEPKSQHYCSTL